MSRLQVLHSSIESLRVRIPVINHALVIQVQASTVVRRGKEVVVTGGFRGEISGPPNGKIIDRMAGSIAALAPVEMNMAVGADHRRRSLQIGVVEILSL